MKKIAYLGIPGSYSFIIAQRLSRKAPLLGKENFEQVIKAIQNKEANLGVVPIENSLTGSVWQVYDLLLEKNLNIVGEKYLQIEHNLLVVKMGPAKFSHRIKLLKKCYSHPQAFDQCRQFFKKFAHIKIEGIGSTVQAAKKIAQDQSLEEGAIASCQAGEIYRLKALKKNIEDNKHNYTRFIIVSRKSTLKKGNKISLIFSIKHVPGSLYNTLKPFAKKRINLTKIESRPIFGKPWEYIFYLDFEFKKEKLIREALKEVEKNVIFLKKLGPYNKEDYAKT